MKKMFYILFGPAVILLAVALTYAFSLEKAPEKVQEVVSEKVVMAPVVEDSTLETKPDVEAETNASKLHICDRSPQRNFSSMFCYTVEPGDTLWGIAERYLFSGFRWKELHDGPPTNGGYLWNFETNRNERVGFFRLDNPPLQLKPGMEVGMYAGAMLPLELVTDPKQYQVQGEVLSPYNDDMLFIINRYGSNRKMVYLNEERYHDAYGHYSHLNFSADGKHISFVAQKSWNECVFIMDKVEHEYPCGNDVQNPVLNATGTHYAFRVNSHDPGHWTGPDPFAIISDLGNGSYYDYVDSLTWVNDETFVYRAQTNGEWRVVINHQDQASYKYVDFLSVNNGVITYSAEHEDGTWTDEVTNL